MQNLFGFEKLSISAPPKVDNIDNIFREPSNQKQEVVFCPDGSGSTAFEQKKFHELYADALSILREQIPKEHKVVCWSSTARFLEGAELSQFNEIITNKIPFALQIKDMNGGTDPQHLLPHLKGKIGVIVTDGEIGDSAISAIRNKISQSGIGAVFLIIIPHIDSYPNMYNGKANVEVSAKDSIRLSIPQAFSEKLATVIIWNFRKKEFEMISELTAPWVDQTKSLFELLSNPVPVTKAGEFLTKSIDNKYKSFSLEELITWLKNNNVDEMTLMKLFDYGVASAIRQQASVSQKDAWNMCIQNVFNKILSFMVSKDFTEEKIPEEVTMIDRIKITMQNEHAKKKIENKYRHHLADLCGKISVGQTVGEFKNVAQAKAKQTDANVGAFKTMKQEDKLTQISFWHVHFA